MSIVEEAPKRANVATLLAYQHEERMARASAAAQPSFEIAQKSPAGKTGGFEFTISGPDPDAVEAKALEWAAKFAAPQPVAKS